MCLYGKTYSESIAKGSLRQKIASMFAHKTFCNANYY